MAYYQWKTVPGVGAVAVARFSKRGKRLSLGPSNDDPALVACEITRAFWFKSDASWEALERSLEGAYDWDVTRPLREQWPWNGWSYDQERMRESAESPALTPEETAAIIAQSSGSYMPFETKHAELIELVKELSASPVEPREGWQERTLAKIDAFTPVDTASREPWQTTESTGDLETQLRAAADEFLDGIGTAALDGEP